MNPKTRTASKRVLVLGDNDMAGLAVVRSLGRMGLEVHLAAFDSKPVTRSSRFVHQLYDFGHPLHDAEAFAQGVIQAARQHNFDLAIPTSDPALVALLPQREELEKHCRFVAPDAAGFQATNDKSATLQLARECNVAVPESVLVDEHNGIAEALALEGLPLVLKPVRSVMPGKTRRNLVRIARNHDAAEQWLPEMLKHSPVLVQRFVGGIGVGLCVLAEKGRIIAAFQHRRVHEPPNGGASSYRASEALDPQLLDGVQRMCSALALSGPAMFEFKRDAASGHHVLMEINGRFWGSLPLAIAAGVDFPALLYNSWVRGETPARNLYRVPMYARYTPQEPYWFLANLRAPSGRSDVIRRGLGETFSEILNMVRLRESWDIESLSDPRPALHSWRATCSELASDVRARLDLRRAKRTLKSLANFSVTTRHGDAPQVLVLCHGNINRSAIAGAYLRSRLSENAGGLKVVSAGFVSEEGRPTSPLSQEIAGELGVDLTRHQSRVVTPELLAGSDIVLIMDARNLQNLSAVSSESAARAIPLGALDAAVSLEIDDPYGEDRKTFRETYRRILVCCDALVSRLQRDD